MASYDELAAASDSSDSSRRIVERSSDAPVTVSRCLEAAVLVFVAAGYLTFFPPPLSCFIEYRERWMV
jgi:hypothetical protein